MNGVVMDDGQLDREIVFLLSPHVQNGPRAVIANAFQVADSTPRMIRVGKGGSKRGYCRLPFGACQGVVQFGCC